jgi:cysteine-rich repeat protein
MKRFLPLVLLSGCGFLNPVIPEDLCGDGIVNGIEGCDDGNQLDRDGCDDDCEIEPGFLCSDTPSACTVACGNGTLDSDLGEACDDGNLRDGDHCNSLCQVEKCGNGNVDNGEDCDDENLLENDGCHNDCTVASCGDGIIDPGQICFDPASAVNLGENTKLVFSFFITVPGTMRFADLNQDSFLDYIVSAPGSDFLLSGLGNGTGLFQNAIKRSTPKPVAISLANIDNDPEDKLDVVVSNGSNVVFFPGAGDGSFEDPIPVQSGNFPIATIAEDLNDDGFIDIPVFSMTNDTSLTNDRFFLFLGNALGELAQDFSNAVSFNEDLNSTDITVADMDNNQKKDIIVANSSQNTVSIFKQSDLGSFVQQKVVQLNQIATTGVSVGDLNNDLLLDVIAANAQSGEITINIQKPDHTFENSVSVFSGILQIQRVVAVDVDNDSNLDIIATVNNAADLFDQDIIILLSNGDGTFQTPTFLEAGRGSFDVSFVDLNGDQAKDLAVLNLNSNDISILLANP